MQPNDIIVKFDKHLEQFCERNGLEKINLASLIISGNKKAMSKMYYAKENDLKNNTILDEENLQKFLTSYNNKVLDIGQKINYLSSWSELSSSMFEKRIYSSQELIRTVVVREIDEYQEKQKVVDAIDRRSINYLEQKQRIAMDMIGKNFSDVKFFKSKETTNGNNKHF